MGASMGVKDISKKEDTDNLDQLLRMLMEKPTTRRVVVLLHLSKKDAEGGTVSEFATKEMYLSATSIPARLCGQGELT